MKKFAIVSKNEGVSVTGGHKYGDHFYKSLKKYFPGEICTITDETLEIQGGRIKRFFSYFSKVDEFGKMDYLFINTINFRWSVFLPYLKKKYPQVKVLAIHHHFAYQTYHKFSLQYYLFKWFELTTLKKADVAVFAGKYPYDFAYKKLRLPKDKMALVESAFDTSRIFSEEGHIPGDFIYVGTIEKRKGIVYLIKALAKIKNDNFKMNIVGKFDPHNKYVKRILEMVEKEGLQDKVRFCGRVTDDELSNLYQKASAFIFPTLNEGYGLVIIEAMSYGVPVIAFNNTAIPYSVKDGYNGFLVKNKNVAELSRVIHGLIEDNSKIKSLSINAFQTYQNVNTFEDFDAQVKELVEKFLN